MSAAIGWDHPDTARYFEEFCSRYARYRSANRNLAARACIAPGSRILDFAAGTGRTAEAALPFLDATGMILCVEPAAAMRAAGENRIRDARLSWTAKMPDDPAGWDRILCGAGIWQLDPLQDLFRRCSRLLKPGGALCFNIPSLYLGEADKPGGGDDPLLLRLAAILSEQRTVPPPPGKPVPNALQVDDMLREADLTPERHAVRARLSYRAYRDWLKIPVNTDAMLAGIDADARAALIDAAYREVDPKSWRWEQWTLWTAWKNGGGA